MPSNTPVVCKSIEASLLSSEKRLEMLQNMIETTSPQNKTRLLKMIVQLEAKIDFLGDGLQACIVANTHNFPDPWLHTITVEIFQVGAALNSYVQNFLIRLHNTGGGDHRSSTFDLQQKDGQGVFNSLSGFPKDLGQLSAGNDYHFNDIKSSSIMLKSLPGISPPLFFNAIFETNDEEIIVNNWFNRDLNLFTVEIELDLGVDPARNLLALHVGDIKSKAVVEHWYGDSEDGEIESGFNKKIQEQLAEFAPVINAGLTNRLISTDRAHFDYKVLSVTRQDDKWVISYDQIPKFILQG
jgi:hypothetical protein